MLEITLEQPADLPAISEHQPVEFAYAALPGARLALRIDGQPLEPFLRPGETAWRWRWNPGSAGGLHKLALEEDAQDGGAMLVRCDLRVVTRKIDQERYEALLEDIQRAAYGVLSTLAGAGAEGNELQREAPWQHSPAEDYYALFEERFAAFERAVRRIAARPREQLRGIDQQTSLGQATEFGAEAIAGLAHGQFDAAPPGVMPELQALLRPGGGLLPRNVPTTRGIPSTDMYEHRLLKHLLTLLLRRARFVGALAERVAAHLAANEAYIGSTSMRRLRAEAIAAGCAQTARVLRELRGLPFLAEVAPLAAFRGATSLLQRDPSYREIYRMWQALRQHPYIAFDSPLFAIPIADLPRLYESWCAIQVAQALLALGGTLREQRLVEQRRPHDDDDDLEFAIALAEHAPLLVIAHSAWTLTLRYQAHYRPGQKAKGKRQKGGDADLLPLESLDRHTRVPDLAIEIQRDGEPARVLLLDAKYRLDADGRGVPQDALADAYAYLGAIGCAGQRATIGALLLYPGLGEPEHYASGVGTIPLLPGRTAALPELLKTWLDGVIEA